MSSDEYVYILFHFFQWQYTYCIDEFEHTFVPEWVSKLRINTKKKKSYIKCRKKKNKNVRMDFIACRRHVYARQLTTKYRPGAIDVRPEISCTL